MPTMYYPTTDIDPEAHYHTECWEGLEDCVCNNPGPVCEEFMKYGPHPYCIRCGWDQATHEVVEKIRQ